MTRTIKLVVHPFNDPDNPWPYGWSAWAYQAGDTIHIRSPAHWSILGGVGRATHELEHALDPAFTNEAHHPAVHLCLRAKVPFRLPYHNKACTIGQAARLLRDGELDVE